MTFPAISLTHDDVRVVRDRFLAKFRPLATDECWEWGAARSKQGYGRFQMPASRGCIGAHRVSFALFARDLLDGETVDHLCRNRACVNPWHLEAVPIHVNVMRGGGICVQHSRKTRCPKGHEYSIRRRSDGRTQRICVECDRAYKREWIRNKRAEA